MAEYDAMIEVVGLVKTTPRPRVSRPVAEAIRAILSGTAGAVGGYAGPLLQWLAEAVISAALSLRPEDAALAMGMDAKLDRLLEGPYRTGRLAMVRAGQTPDEVMRSRLLYTGVEAFLRAAGQAGGDRRLSGLCLVQEAWCYVGLGSEATALAPLRHAFGVIGDEVRVLAQTGVAQGGRSRRWYFPAATRTRPLTSQEIAARGIAGAGLAELIELLYAIAATSYRLGDPEVTSWFGVGGEFTLQMPVDGRDGETVWVLPQPDFVRQLAA